MTKPKRFVLWTFQARSVSRQSPHLFVSFIGDQSRRKYLNMQSRFSQQYGGRTETLETVRRQALPSTLAAQKMPGDLGVALTNIPDLKVRMHDAHNYLRASRRPSPVVPGKVDRVCPRIISTVHPLFRIKSDA
jgi:hypothetical protein